MRITTRAFPIEERLLRIQVPARGGGGGGGVYNDVLNRHLNLLITTLRLWFIL